MQRLVLILLAIFALFIFIASFEANAHSAGHTENGRFAEKTVNSIENSAEIGP